MLAERSIDGRDGEIDRQRGAAADSLKAAARALKASSNLLNDAVKRQGELPAGDRQKMSDAGSTALKGVATPMVTAATDTAAVSTALVPSAKVADADKT